MPYPEKRGLLVSQTGKNVLISLESRHAECVTSGKKKVELRTRRMNLSKGDRVWIYKKQPEGGIVCAATVKAVDEGSPKALWGQYRAVCGITKEEFFAYFAAVKIGYAISLYKIERLPKPVSLKRMRTKDQNFHPPQFSKYLIDKTPLLTFLEASLRARYTGDSQRQANSDTA